jgi:hypothetical protein
MRTRACLLALCAAALARPAAAAPLPRGQPPLWLALEGLYAEPGGDASRGPGAGLRLGYRFTDQFSAVVGFSTLLPRGGPLTNVAAGFEATLDDTPIAPFLELSVLRADPVGRAGFTLAQRTGFGADVRLAPGVAVGAVVRYVTPLDPEPGLSGSSLSGLELGLRLVLVPGFL